MVSKSIAALLLASLLMIAVPVSSSGPTDYVECANGRINVKDPSGYPVGVVQCLGEQLQECWFAPRTMDARPLPEEIERNLNWAERCIEEDTGLSVEFALITVTYDGQGWNAHVEVRVNAFQGIAVGAIVGADGVHVYEKMGIHGCYAGVSQYGVYSYCVY